MEYRIVLSRMEFRALHGCYVQDDVCKTVNYLTVYEVVRMQMRITQHTIERVAMNIIEAIYAAFAQVRHVKCTVSKLAPPLGGKLEKVSVVLEK